MAAKKPDRKTLEAALRRALSYIETFGVEDNGMPTDYAMQALVEGYKALGKPLPKYEPTTSDD